MNMMVKPDDPNELAIDIAEAVRSTALLASLTISLWSAERSDRGLMTKLKEEEGAVGDAGRVIKNLFCGVDEHLRKVQAAYKQARYAHYDLTLPWITNPRASTQGGPRLLPTALFEKYLTTMSEIRTKANQSLDEFVADYQGHVARAMANLGGMAKASDYPSAEEVRGLFRLSFDFEPIPSGASFQGLAPAMTAKLASLLEQKQQRAAEAAQKAMWDQVKERVGHLMERLADPDTRFKAATIEDARSLLTLLPGWNVTDCDEVHEVVEDIRCMLTGVDADILRKNTEVRAGVATQAKAIVDKLAAWNL